MKQAPESHLPNYQSLAGQIAYLAAYDRAVAAWAVPCKQIDIPTSFGSTHVLEFGNPQGQALVLFHWLIGNSTIWQNMAASLAARFRVYAVDTLGDVGKSIPTKAPKSEADIANWYRQLANGLGLERPVIGGLSYGGFQAAVIARQCPESVAKLILMAPAAVVHSVHPRFFQLLFSLILFHNDRVIKRFATTITRQPANWGPDLAYMLDQVFRVGKGGMGPIPYRFSQVTLRSIAAPVLLILGDGEFIYSVPKAVRRMAKKLPSCKTVVLADCGHTISVDAPEAAAKAIEDFVFGS